MEVFNLIVDEQSTIWRRSHIKISAESLEEALLTIKKSGLDDIDEIVDSYHLYESEEIMSPCLDYPLTQVIMDEQYNLLDDNDISGK